MDRNTICFGTWDNLKELSDKFDVVADPVRFAGGFAYVCKKCGHEADLTQEDYYPCQKQFVASKVSCHSCGVRWRLKIERGVEVM